MNIFDQFDLRLRVHCMELKRRALRMTLRRRRFLDPNLDDGLLFDNLGLALMAQNKFTEAIADFSRAIGRRLRPATSYFNRSLAYERSGQLDAAISDMNAVIQLVAGYAEAHSIYGWAWPFGAVEAI